MIKFVARGQVDGKVLLGIVLSYANLDELRKGAPILFDFSEVNVGLPEGSRFPDGQVFLAADVDEETVLAQFQARGVQIEQLIDTKTPHEAEKVLRDASRDI